MAYFVLGVALLFGFFLLVRGLSSVNPKLLAWLVRILAVALAITIPAFLLVTGQGRIILYALPFALPLFFHWRANRLRRQGAQGPAPGGTSSVDTGWLRMELDHDSGKMQGTVQRGRFAGRGLASMSLEELRDLYDEIGADPDSLRVLEAYLDRVHGPAWRGDDPGAGEEGGQEQDESEHRGEERWKHGAGGDWHLGAMTEAEALEILGLSPGAGPDAIKKAHHRLMAKLHPDRGGSTYLAAKLNAAKDRLLKRR